MSTRNCGGMPCALATSSVLTKTPSSTVASCTMALTAYSALADIRMLVRLVGNVGPVCHRRREAPRQTGRQGRVADAETVLATSAGDGKHRVSKLRTTHDEVGQPRIGLVVGQRRAVDARCVQTRGAGHGDGRRRVPFVL